MILTNLGTVRKTVATGASSWGNAQIDNQGTFDLQSGSFSLGGHFVQHAGTTRLGSGSLTVPVGVDVRAGILQGSGTVVADVMSAGSVEPGTPVGTMVITGNYRQEAGGALTLDLAGADPDQFDQFRVNGIATLDGRLDARLAGGCSPGFGTRFQCLSAGSITGTFASFSGDALPSGNFLTPVYSATGIDLIALDARPEFMVTGISITGDMFTIQLKGIANQPYVIEATTNVSPPVIWASLATNTVPGSTLWEFVDPGVTNYSQRFLRARFAPSP